MALAQLDWIGGGGISIDWNNTSTIYANQDASGNYTLPASKYSTYLVCHDLAATSPAERPVANLTNGTFTKIGTSVWGNNRIDTYIIEKTDKSQASTFTGVNGSNLLVVAIF